MEKKKGNIGRLVVGTQFFPLARVSFSLPPTGACAESLLTIPLRNIAVDSVCHL